MIEKIALCFDMAGCPNNCGHCWIKTSGNGFVNQSDVRKISKDFKEITDEIDVYTWYLEPDYPPNYKELWSLEQEISTKKHKHFELLSDWRIIKDDDYLKWAHEIGVRTCQLTFFGMENTTDKMTGRKNAFKELFEVTEKLIQNDISPRYQLFIYNFNIKEISEFMNYIKVLRVQERCNEKGLEFKIFAHTGSCIGNAMKLYDNWLTEENIEKLPAELIESTKSHYKTDETSDIFGSPEKKLYQDIIETDSVVSIEIDKVILYINGRLDVFPHFVVQKPWWKIGNLIDESAEEIVNKYLSGKTIAQEVRSKIPLSEMVKKFGDTSSNKMFHKSDYIDYITEKYLEWYYTTL